MRSLVSLFLLALLCFAVSQAHADAVPIVDGRYNGPASLLTLSPEQLRDVETTRRFVLSESQKSELAQAIPEVPSTLEVETAREAEVGCTCHTYNLAIWLSHSVVQVPHTFLRGDNHSAFKLLEASAPDSTSLRVLADLKGKLYVNGQLTTLDQIESRLRKSEPAITDVYLKMPPEAPDISLTKKQRQRIYETLSGFSDRYQTGLICLE